MRDGLVAGEAQAPFYMSGRVNCDAGAGFHRLIKYIGLDESARQVAQGKNSPDGRCYCGDRMSRSMQDLSAGAEAMIWNVGRNYH